MRKMKVTSILITLAMLLTLCSGCGAKETSAEQTTAGQTTTIASSETTTAATTTDSETQAESSQTSSGMVAGTELSSFFQKYMDSKSSAWEKLSEKLESGEEPTAALALMGFAFADLAVAIVPMFDAVEAAGGILPLAGIKNAYKTRKGNTFEFGYDYVFDEASGNYVKGDHVKCTGKYDTDQGCIMVEMIDMSGDKVTNHVIIEIARNSDKAYVSQTLMYDASSEKVTGYFTQFENEDIWSDIGEKEIGKEFKYNSIYGKSGLKLDDMIKDFKIMTRVTFIDGEAKVTTETN